MELILSYSNTIPLNQLKACGLTGIIIGQSAYSHRFGYYYTQQELIELALECQRLNLNLYLNMNRIIMEEEIAGLETYLKAIRPYVDGIYFNDLSVLYHAKALEMQGLCIFNPDTLLTNSQDIEFYLEQGIKGAVISKELTLEEIMAMLNYSQKPLDLIIHGYLNMSYSKRRFIDSYFQHLNKPVSYDNQLDLRLIESTRTYPMPIIEDQHGTAIYTDFILQSFNEIIALKAANLGRAIIDALFISDEELLASLHLYQAILAEQPADSDSFIKHYSKSNYSTGYHYQKTNLVK